MRSIFSRQGHSLLDDFCGEDTLFAFDFDGTIAPLVSDPDEAFTLKTLRLPLRKLSKMAPTAVISGRGKADVASRLGFPTSFVIGNHGLEGLREFEVKADRAEKICRQWVKQLQKALPEDPGVYLEDKGHSLSVHFRHAARPIKIKNILSQEISKLAPAPRVVGGKLIFNLVPKGSPHKGTALKVLMGKTGVSRAIFVGDDVTDEDAFAEKGQILSIRVGKKRDSRADFFVQNLDAMPIFLNECLRRMK